MKSCMRFLHFSSRNTRDFHRGISAQSDTCLHHGIRAQDDTRLHHGIRAQGDTGLHREYSPAMKNQVLQAGIEKQPAHSCFFKTQLHYISQLRRKALFGKINGTVDHCAYGPIQAVPASEPFKLQAEVQEVCGKHFD